MSKQKAQRDLRKAAFFFDNLATALYEAETTEEIEYVYKRLQRYQNGEEGPSPKARWAEKMLKAELEERNND